MSAESLRYVALGDSLSEGVGDDPWPDLTPRGWTDRLAALLAAHHQPRVVDYANLAIRGLRSTQILETQVAGALQMQPDVVTISAGMNDILHRRIDFAAIARTINDLVAPFAERGARVVVIPIPNVASLSPAGRLLEARRLRLNEIYADLVQRHGVLPLADTDGSVFEDPRAWDEDRLHLARLGHERLALAVGHALGLPVSEDWRTRPEGSPPPRTLADEVQWAWRHLTPWVGRRLRGRSSGDGRTAKRPELSPVTDAFA